MLVCSSARFLLHRNVFILDHTSGLAPSWNFGVIVCSAVTRRLLLDKFEVDDAFVRVLAVGEPTSLALDARGSVCATVTLLDANHCPGAVMVLLEGYFGTVLHTGDFRFHPRMLDEPALNGKFVDHLVLDNTYASPGVVFPSRARVGGRYGGGADFYGAQEAVAEEMLAFIRQNAGDRRIAIGVDTLGKEELLLYLAQALDCAVLVDERRYRALQLIDIDISYFTYDPQDEALIVVVSRQEICSARMAAVADNALLLLPSSLFKVLPLASGPVHVRAR